MLSAKTHKQAKKDALQWLIKLQSPELSQEDEARFFAWLEEAPEHQFAYVQAEQLWERTGNLKALIKLLKNHQQPRGMFIFSWPYAGIASAALAVFLFVFLLPNFTSTKFETIEYATAIGEQRLITLDDGSTAFLNTRSRIKVSYTKESRTVSLEEGEAFFKVIHDADRPFLVPIELGTVRVLGTAFLVRKNAEDAIVTVLEGKVGLLDNNDSSANNLTTTVNTTLSSGEQLSFLEAEQNIQAKKVDAKSLLNWRSGQLVFRGEPLSSVVSELNRYSKYPIRIGSETLEQQRVIAVIQVNNINDAIETLTESLDIRSAQLEDGSIQLLPQNSAP